MRKQIAAANWKMNLTYYEGEELLDTIIGETKVISDTQQVIFAVPFPYLAMANQKVKAQNNINIAAQNCSHQKNGAFTGEVSAEMLRSIHIIYCVVGHSERREYYGESNDIIRQKVDRCLANDISPIFCCGEALHVREQEGQNAFVQQQLEQSLFHLDEAQMRKIIIAYEPIWAIGTGKTASTEQAQEMHAYIRLVISEKWGEALANDISILYGGSVKANNAKELFGQPDVDGGLVGGASLIASDFSTIIASLKT